MQEEEVTVVPGHFMSLQWRRVEVASCEDGRQQCRWIYRTGFAYPGRPLNQASLTDKCALRN